MKLAMITGASLLALTVGAPALSDPGEDRIAELEARIEQLEETNRRLLDYLEAQGALDPRAPAATAAPARDLTHTAARETDDPEVLTRPEAAPGAEPSRTLGDQFVGMNSAYSFAMLDHAETTNTRQLVQLRAIQSGELNNRVTLGGEITVLADYQESNSNTKFGWLMRHPTSANQIGETVSEFVIHNAQIAVTGRLTNDITSYVELLYDPEQSFGSGTLTDLTRNQIQLRRGWVMWGNLDERPVYVAVGKMDTPFGLNDTVSPFTNSTNWHAFAGLAYGGLAGYYNNGLHLRAMAIQGGAQFRAHNAPVEDTAVPSRVNNFAFDANYTAALDAGSVMVGASYTHASAYCQAYPVFHFNPCDDNNPAWAVYSRAELGAFELLAEYGSTTEEWPGTASPVPFYSRFEAVKAESFTLGGRYWMNLHREDDFALSAEFSRFISGDDGAPWERQDQYVFGASYFVVPNVNLFGELIHTRGWVPLNFLSGGNFADGTSWSESDAETNVIAVGVQAAF